VEGWMRGLGGIGRICSTQPSPGCPLHAVTAGLPQNEKEMGVEIGPTADESQDDLLAN
jgi:hypothetical protein